MKDKNKPYIELDAKICSMVTLALYEGETLADMVRSSLAWLNNPERIEIKEIRLVER